MRRGIDKEKVIAYRRSKLFPWNFIFEDVDERAIEYFAPYAVQILGGRHDQKKEESAQRSLREHAEAGVKRGAFHSGGGSSAEERFVDKEYLRRRIREEVSAVVSDFLFDTDDEDAIKMHGDFAQFFPFAFSQCLVQAMLHRMNMRLEDVIDVNAISELMGTNVNEIRRREDLIRDLINKKRNLNLSGRNLLGKKVMSESGEYVGNVSDIIFDDKSGVMKGLRVAVKGGGRRVSERLNNAFGRAGSVRMRGGEIEIQMQEVRFNSYNCGFVLKLV